MTSPPPSPDPTRGFREFLSSKFSRSRPNSPSGPALASQSPLPSPPSLGRISPTPTTDSGVLSTEVHRVEQEPRPHLHLQVPGVNPPRSGQPSTSLSTTSIANSLSANPSNLGSPRTPSTSRTKPASSTVWTGLATSLRAIENSTAVLPPLRSAVGALLSSLDILQEAAKHRQEYEDLASELMSSSMALEQYMNQGMSARMADSVVRTARLIEAQSRVLDAKRSRGGVRLWKDTIADDEELMRSYRQIQNSFRMLQTDAAMNATMIAEEEQMNNRLVALNPVKLAYYNSTLSTEVGRGACAGETREYLLGDLRNWTWDPNSRQVYWMNGMAGTGKTTVAYSFSEWLEVNHALAASFFCAPQCRDVNQVIPTIAYQLARYSPPFRLALCEELGRDPDVNSKTVPIQFKQLLVQPLLSVKGALPDGVVVVIDALDECRDRKGTRLLIETLSRYVFDLPLKFFITSRPGGTIYYEVLSHSSSSCLVHLHEIDPSIVEHDIEKYLRAELGSIASPDQVSELARRSGKQFIVAATLVHYILSFGRPTHSQGRLQSVIGISSPILPRQVYAKLDELYDAALNEAYENRFDEEEVQRIQRVLWTAVCVQEPVRLETIAALAGIDDELFAITAIDALRSVIHVSEHSGLISTLDRSFPDYIFSKERSGVFFCNSTHHNELLAQQCFGVMKSQLRFNVCRLESSFLRDRDIPDLENRINASVSPVLFYACRYWDHHLTLAGYSDTLCTMLSDFLSDRLLSWVEVLNLKRTDGLGAEMLRRAKLWLEIGIASHKIGGRAESGAIAFSEELSKLIDDAWKFVAVFTLNSVSQSTPHIYTSMLPFWPDSSPIAKHYAERIRMPIALQGSAIARRKPELLASWPVSGTANQITWSPDGRSIAWAAGHKIFIQNAVTGLIIMGPMQQNESSIQSLGFSPDGIHIASGLANGNIDVWNWRREFRVLGPLKGHSDCVTAVAFSPDGTRIVSGSRDSTIRVWDAGSGTTLFSPLEGHTDWVTSVAFSPDGTRVVSGSDDRTIRLWGVSSGLALLDPLEGHTHWVTSVAFSPDGTRIISGSWDKTIRMWDAHTGQTLLGPLEGHNELITSVVFSPDGTRIVSGSYDKTIRIWGEQGEQIVLGPLEGHTAWVASIAPSPDGTRIVSCSGDKTISMWDLQSEQRELGPPPVGHSGPVTSVAFSPDGVHIVSGSNDKMIRTWDARGGQMVRTTYEGHTNSVTSLAFSPDGTWVVSGSWDQTIRMWDVRSASGQTVLEGHTDLVTSVVFSPDGARIVSGSNDKTVRIWDAQNGRAVLHPLQGHTGSVTSLAFSPDGTRIISGSYDKTIRMWDGQSGQLVLSPLKGHTDLVSSIAFSPNGACILSGSYDQDIRTWDAQSGETILAIKGHTNWIASVAFSPDGARIISGAYDKTICMWDTRSGQMMLGPLKGHTGPVVSVSFSPDGTRVISGSHDQTIRMWDVRIEQTTVPSRNSTLVEGLSWRMNPDGWVEDDNCRLLAWVPPDLRRVLLPSRNVWCISNAESVGLNFEDGWTKRSWDECYVDK